MNPEEIAGFYETEGTKLGSGTSSSEQSNVDGIKAISMFVKRGGKKLGIVITGNPGEDSRVHVGYEGAK
jgi:hypothetical protein